MSMGHHWPLAEASKLPSAQEKSRSATDQAKSEMVDITSRTWASPISTPAPATSQLCPRRKLGNLSGTLTGVPLPVSREQQMHIPCQAPLFRSRGPARPLAAGCLGDSLGYGSVWFLPHWGDPGAALGGWPPPALLWRRLGKLPNGASVLKPAGGMPPSALQKLFLQLSPCGELSSQGLTPRPSV